MFSPNSWMLAGSRKEIWLASCLIGPKEAWVASELTVRAYTCWCVHVHVCVRVCMYVCACMCVCVCVCVYVREREFPLKEMHPLHLELVKIIGASAASPTLVVKTENCLYVNMFGTYVFRIYISCPICVRCNCMLVCFM